MKLTDVTVLDTRIFSQHFRVLELAIEDEGIARTRRIVLGDGSFVGLLEFPLDDNNALLRIMDRGQDLVKDFSQAVHDSVNDNCRQVIDEDRVLDTVTVLMNDIAKGTVDGIVIRQCGILSQIRHFR
jgi:hypothetical protein